jgi:hypothetical protein
VGFLTVPALKAGSKAEVNMVEKLNRLIYLELETER